VLLLPFARTVEYAQTGFLSLQLLVQQYIFARAGVPKKAATDASRIATLMETYGTHFWSASGDVPALALSAAWESIASFLPIAYATNNSTTSSLVELMAATDWGAYGAVVQGAIVSGGVTDDCIGCPVDLQGLHDLKEDMQCAEAAVTYATEQYRLTPAQVDFTPLPTYSYAFNTFYLVIASWILALLYTIAFTMSVFLIHVNLLREKETKMREMLKMMVSDA
jgi:hypothetical protein